MHIVQTYAAEEARKFAEHDPISKMMSIPNWPLKDKVLISKIEKVEHWGSSFSDPGPDFNLMKCFDADGKLVHEERIDGY